MLKQLYKLLHPGIQKLTLDYPVDLRPRYGHGQPPHGRLRAIIDEGRDRYRALLTEALGHREALWTIRDAGVETDPAQPTWNNGFLPGLDVVGIYTMLAHYRPARYLEVGSGNSTKVAAKAKRDLGLPTEITSVDPAPRAEIDALADVVVREPFERIDLARVLALEAGDVLFIDNSHRILPNSDAMVFFLEVLPELAPGVVVHVHDIYLPYDYPPFMCDRFYSEQYGLALNLMANPRRYRTLLPNYYVSEDPELSAVVAPLWEGEHLRAVERHGGSYWLEIGAG